MFTQEIEMIYYYDNNNNINNEIKTRIFGNKFVENNYHNCKIIFNNEEYPLHEYFNDINENYNNKDDIKFKLKISEDIISLNDMFSGCKTFKFLPDISGLNTSDIIEMKSIFLNCKSFI